MDPRTANPYEIMQRRELLIQAAARVESLVREARDHPIGLAKLLLHSDDGGPPDIAWFHREWMNLAMTKSELMIEAPRGSAKTSFMVLIWSLWLLGHDPNLRIKIVCGTENDAVARLKEIRTYIKDDPYYRKVFPHVVIDPEQTNTTTRLTIARTTIHRDPSIQAVSISGTTVGSRCDVLILDDIVTYKNALLEPSSREKILDKLRGDLLPTKVPTGRLVAIFTPWHKEDANAHYKKLGVWYYKRYAHGAPGNPYKSIWPNVYPDKLLKFKHLEVGALEYARAYLCKELDDESQIVRSEWLHTYNRRILTKEILRQCEWILSIDPAGGKKSPVHTGSRASGEQDFTGYTILGYHNPDNSPFGAKIFIPEAYGTRLSTNNIVQHAIHLVRKWRPTHILIENQGAMSVYEWFVEKVPQLQAMVTPIKATISKKERLASITPLLERGNVYFHPRVIRTGGGEFTLPSGDPAFRHLRSQMLDFPLKHDDILDSTVQGLRYINHNLIPLPEDDEDYTMSAPHLNIDADIQMFDISL